MGSYTLINPAQARVALLLGQDPFVYEGVSYYLDGPFMSPFELWAAVAQLPSGDFLFTSGEPGDTINEDNYWVSSDV